MFRAVLEDITEARFDEVFELNVKGVFFVVQKALPLLADGGAIVLTTSIDRARITDAGRTCSIKAFSLTRNCRPRAGSRKA